MGDSATSSPQARCKVLEILPVVRTPSKTHEKPLGAVFLIFKNETKRALLPNEITSMDTVKALFVRSFIGEISMNFFNQSGVKIFIRDCYKDNFYDLESLADIIDGSILKLFVPDYYSSNPPCRPPLSRAVSLGYNTQNKGKLENLRGRFSSIDCAASMPFVFSENYHHQGCHLKPKQLNPASYSTFPDTRNKTLGKKTVSFDEAISYSDGKPLKRHLKNSNYNQITIGEFASLTAHFENSFETDFHKKLGKIQRSARELKKSVRVLHRLTQLQSIAMKDIVQDTFLKLNDACIGFAMSQPGNPTLDAKNDDFKTVGENKEEFCIALDELTTDFQKLEIQVEKSRCDVVNQLRTLKPCEIKVLIVKLNQINFMITRLKAALPKIQEKNGKDGVFLFSTSEKLETLWKGCKRITKTLLALDHLIEFHQSDSSSFSGRKNFVTQKLTNELFYENLSDNVKKPSTDIVDPEKIVFSKKTGASELENFDMSSVHPLFIEHSSSANNKMDESPIPPRRTTSKRERNELQNLN